MRALVMPLATAGLAVALAPAAPAHADPPDVNRFHVVSTETFDDVLCDIPVTTTLEARQTITEHFVGGEFDHVDVTGHVRLVSTAENGSSVTVLASGRSTIEEVVNDDGILTVTATFRGLPELVQDKGRPLVADRGLITFVDTIDLGDPDDFTDDVLLSSVVTRQAGPHPEADSDFTLFCDAVTDALT